MNPVPYQLLDVIDQELHFILVKKSSLGTQPIEQQTQGLTCHGKLISFFYEFGGFITSFCI